MTKPQPDSKEWWQEVAQGLGVKLFEANERIATLEAALDAAEQRGSPRLNDALEALEFAHGAILDAIGLEEGLDGAAGMKVLTMIRAALTTHGRTPPDLGTIEQETAPYVDTLQRLDAAEQRGRDDFGPFFVRDMARLFGLPDNASMDAVFKAAAEQRGAARRSGAAVIADYAEGLRGQITAEFRHFSADTVERLVEICEQRGAARGTQWQPIEQHDGSAESVLVADADGYVVEAYYNAERNAWWELNSVDDGAPGSDRRVTPTHFMTKPVAPAKVAV